ncbi:MAG: hypothetical protein BMS9Abin03_171 [Thermodesulfobacteriota bacterium]|nr:MAG: hypothetical protein BMS9Abin03_171 [Thermodesulfobacteriota bacterium]
MNTKIGWIIVCLKNIRLLLGGVSVLMIGGSLSHVFAGPITFNTALAVSKGEGIFRVQSKYIRSTGDPGPMNRELEVWFLPVIGVYGLTEKWALFGIAPFLSKDLEVTTPAGSKTRNIDGLGDMRFFARYTALQWDEPGRTFRIAPFMGIEVPTGKDDEKDNIGRLPQPFQLGSGSWDPFLGIVLTRQTLEWEFDASISYQINTKANDFRFGDAARLNLSYQYRLWPRELSSGVPGFFYGVLESNLIWQDKNELGGSPDKDSGGTILYLTPGLQYVSRRFIIEAAVQLPVVQDLNGAGLENDFISTLSFRVNF